MDLKRIELNELKKNLKTLEELKRFDVALTAQMTKLNHNCEVCARRATELYFKSGGIVTVTGTLLFVTVAYSLGWLSGAMFCCIIWLLQLHSLSEIGQWQIDVDFCRQNCRESSKFECEEHVTKVNQLEREIVRLRHQRAEDQKCHEFQLQQQLKSEAERISESRKRIEVLNADRQSLLEKEIDKLTTEIQVLETRKSQDERIHKLELDESKKTVAALRKEIDALEVPDGSCPICFEKYSDERHLACFVRCGHMLCYSCAKKIAADQHACHKCRAQVQKTDGIQRLYF